MVAFPSVLDKDAVATLRELAHTTLQNGTAFDHAMREGRGGGPLRHRRIRPVPVEHYRSVLSLLASVLAPFLTEGLMSARGALLLSSGVMRTDAGAVRQPFHRDNGVVDGRIAAVQIALGDTQPTQGALHLQPASHHGRRQVGGPQGVAMAPVREGTVVFYAPSVLHAGGAHTHPRRESRLVWTLALMGADAVTPADLEVTIAPEDTGRWWLADGEVHDCVQRSAAAAVCSINSS